MEFEDFQSLIIKLCAKLQNYKHEQIKPATFTCIENEINLFFAKLGFNHIGGEVFVDMNDISGRSIKCIFRNKKTGKIFSHIEDLYEELYPSPKIFRNTSTPEGQAFGANAERSSAAYKLMLPYKKYEKTWDNFASLNDRLALALEHNLGLELTSEDVQKLKKIIDECCKTEK